MYNKNRIIIIEQRMWCEKTLKKLDSQIDRSLKNDK